MPKKKSDQSQVVFYQTSDGKVTVNVPTWAAAT